MQKTSKTSQSSSHLVLDFLLCNLGLKYCMIYLRLGSFPMALTLCFNCQALKDGLFTIQPSVYNRIPLMTFKISLHVCRRQPPNFRRAEAGFPQLRSPQTALNICPLNFEECTSTIPMFSFSLEPFQFEHQYRHYFDHFSEHITEALILQFRHFDEYLVVPTHMPHFKNVKLS